MGLGFVGLGALRRLCDVGEMGMGLGFVEPGAPRYI
jgi:hypothetical protein